MRSLIGSIFIMMISTIVAASSANPETPAFISAKPVWLSGRQTEMNLFAGFRAQFTAPTTGSTTLRLTASTIYRAFINGQFAGYGPARGPHGYYRVDEWDITPLLSPGKNTVAIEVAGYNMNSFYLLEQPSFLQAEVINNGNTLAATATDQSVDDTDSNSFEGFELPWRRQKIQRISFMRPAAEAYTMQQGDAQWRTGDDSRAIPQPLEQTDPKTLLARGVTYPKFHTMQPVAYHASGTIKQLDEPPFKWKDRSLAKIGPKLHGFKQNELELTMTDEFLKHPIDTATSMNDRYNPNKPADLQSLHFQEVDFGRILTGFAGCRVQCTTATRIALTFDETLTKDHVYPLRQGLVNGVIYDLEPGSYDLEMFEPFTFRWFNVAVYSGAAKVDNIHIREYACDDVWTAEFRSGVPELNALFDAGRETFRQNALDTFMDCPSRERAGYLCDSFFSARAAADLCPNLKIENVFFQNYLLPKTFEHIPDGMLPMCYPADHNQSIYIPQWAMWFVVQLDEYSQRTTDESIVQALKPRVEKLMNYFSKFENSDGLLEKLDGWNFIEWSKSQDFMQDVNYPTNMLYAKALSIAGRLYDHPDYIAKADKIKTTIFEQSFDGEFFTDNAVRKNGSLEVTKNHTEVCQYFAFFFDIVTPESQPDLWNRLVNDFGPTRAGTKKWPDVYPANAFIGNVMRLELLSRNGLSRQTVNESVGYYLKQAVQSGTLWEMDKPTNSMDHGFAGHICHLLYRDALGIKNIDRKAKTIKIHFTDTGALGCEGRIPVPDGFVSLKWERVKNAIRYSCETPAGYTVEIDADKGLRFGTD